MFGAGAPVHGDPATTAAISTDIVALGPGVVTHPMAAERPIDLTVALAPSGGPSLGAFLENVENPASPEYRQYITTAEYRAEFSPTDAQVAAVESYFAAHGAQGFAVTADRFGVSFQIPSGEVPSALGVQVVTVPAIARGPPVYTALGTPELPDGIRSLVAGIDGLSDAANAGYSTSLDEAPHSTLARVVPGEFVNGIDGTPWWVGSDFTSASRVSQFFPPSPQPNAMFPSHEAVATLLMSSYNQTNNTDLPPFDPVVVNAYFNDTFPAAWPHPAVVGVPVQVDGITPPPPGYLNGSNDSTLNEAENSLDLEMVGSMAPGATLVNFYFAASIVDAPSATPSPGDLADDFATSLASALAYNYSPARLAVVSGSFGLPDLNDSLWNTESEEAAATGVTLLAASGDQGDAPEPLTGRFQGQWPSWPGTAAFNTSGTIAVGGLSVNVTGGPNGSYESNGTLNAEFDPSVSGYSSLSAWFDASGGPGNLSGTEGGASALYPEPAWQFDSAAQPNIVNATVAQGLGSLGRAEPDVSFPAEYVIAYLARDAGGTYFEILAGTSVAAPLFAGFLASAAAFAGHPYGYLDPELYRIASFYQANPTDPDTPFLDVTNGSNYAFSAGPGWDAATGWGTVDGPRFLAADANPVIRNYTYTGPTPGLPPPFSFSSGPPSLSFLVVIGIAVTLAVVLVITVLRPTPPSPSRPAPGPGAPGAYPPSYQDPYAIPPPAPGSLPPPAPNAYAAGAPIGPVTFLCPYCGQARPAEPVRCPSCGRL